MLCIPISTDLRILLPINPTRFRSPFFYGWKRWDVFFTLPRTDVEMLGHDFFRMKLNKLSWDLDVQWQFFCFPAHLERRKWDIIYIMIQPIPHCTSEKKTKQEPAKMMLGRLKFPFGLISFRVFFFVFLVFFPAKNRHIKSLLLMVQKSPSQPPGMYKPCK